ncbi:MAG: helix-turn-helix transcriptional regulator [Spirochaetales bacterium]|nr:helix-turn-helix transcriptional regulator [Spirochaetales bacterium]
MPRSFSENEKLSIRSTLIEKGSVLFGQYGLKKTSIDEIVKAAGIAKGSFYKFFKSKEDLFFICMEFQELAMQEKYLIPILTKSENSSEMFNKLFKLMFELPAEYPLIINMIAKEEYDTLLRGLPEETIESHRTKDMREMAGFMDLWQNMGIVVNEKPEVLNGLFQALVMLNLHKNEVGKDIFPESMGLLSKILAAGMESLYVKGETV